MATNAYASQIQKTMSALQLLQVLQEARARIEQQHLPAQLAQVSALWAIASRPSHSSPTAVSLPPSEILSEVSPALVNAESYPKNGAFRVQPTVSESNSTTEGGDESSAPAPMDDCHVDQETQQPQGADQACEEAANTPAHQPVPRCNGEALLGERALPIDGQALVGVRPDLDETSTAFPDMPDMDLPQFEDEPCYTQGLNMAPELAESVREGEDWIDAIFKIDATDLLSVDDQPPSLIHSPSDGSLSPSSPSEDQPTFPMIAGNGSPQLYCSLNQCQEGLDSPSNKRPLSGEDLQGLSWQAAPEQGNPEFYNAGSGQPSSKKRRFRFVRRGGLRKGTSTDRHCVKARERRERISNQLSTLQDLVPDSKNVDTATLLEKAISYVKVLQEQVKSDC